jgi:hypothetical protein
MMKEGECSLVCDFAGLLSSIFPFFMYLSLSQNEKTLMDVIFFIRDSAQLYEERRGRAWKEETVALGDLLFFSLG